MFTRVVRMRLKPNSTTQFSQTMEKKVLPILRSQKGFRDEITLIATGGTEVIGVSFWESRDQAEMYNNSKYPEVMKELANVTEGTPRVETFDVVNSTVHKIAAAPAA